MRGIRFYFIIVVLAILSLAFIAFNSCAQVITLNAQTLSGYHDYNDSTVRIDGYIDGNFTFENARIVVHSKYAHVFDTTISFINCTFESPGEDGFSTAWNGAKSNRPDNYRFLQKAIDICLQNNVSKLYIASSYDYSQTLKVERVSGGNFVAVNLNIYGDGSMHNQRQTLRYQGTGIALGVQLAKGGSFKGLWIEGSYTPSTSTGLAYYNNPWPTMPGHIGIAIDYDGTRNNSGSSDFKIIECNTRFFDIGYAVSPNPTTNNADLLLFDRIRGHDCRVIIKSGQPQEKGCIITYIESWGKVHTVFQNGVDSRGAGDYVIKAGNVAGEPVQLFDVVLAGYNNFRVESFYAESLGRIGRVNAFTSGSKMPASISVDVRLRHPSVAGNQIIFTGGHGHTMLRNCVIRYYGETGFTINMNSNFTIFDCDFEFSTLNAPSAITVDFHQDKMFIRKAEIGKAYYIP